MIEWLCILAFWFILATLIIIAYAYLQYHATRIKNLENAVLKLLEIKINVGDLNAHSQLQQLQRKTNQ